MNSTKVFAIVLFAAGLIALAYQGVTYTSRDKVVDLGPLQVTAEKTHTLPLPPIIGGLALLAGIGLFVVEGKRR